MILPKYAFGNFKGAYIILSVTLYCTLRLHLLSIKIIWYFFLHEIPSSFVFLYVDVIFLNPKYKVHTKCLDHLMWVCHIILHTDTILDEEWVIYSSFLNFNMPLNYLIILLKCSFWCIYSRVGLRVWIFTKPLGNSSPWIILWIVAIWVTL